MPEDLMRLEPWNPDAIMTDEDRALVCLVTRTLATPAFYAPVMAGAK